MLNKTQGLYIKAEKGLVKRIRSLAIHKVSFNLKLLLGATAGQSNNFLPLTITVAIINTIGKTVMITPTKVYVFIGF